jgi:hypothetical protein
MEWYLYYKYPWCYDYPPIHDVISILPIHGVMIVLPICVASIKEMLILP